MKSLITMAVGTVTALASGVSFAQSGNMMNGGGNSVTRSVSSIASSTCSATSRRFRLGFFRDLLDIADRSNQEAIALDLALPLAAIGRQIDSGAAHAAPCADFDAKERQFVEGSPTFMLDDGRQKLYGNVGYRIIEANITELLVDLGDRASW